MRIHVFEKPVFRIDDVKAVEQRVRESIEGMLRRFGSSERLVSVECITIKALERLVCDYGVVVTEDDEYYNVGYISEEEKEPLKFRTVVRPLAAFRKGVKFTWYCCEEQRLVCLAVRGGGLEDLLATDIMTLLMYLRERGGDAVMLFEDPVEHGNAYLLALRHLSEVVRVKETDECPCEKALKLYEVTKP